MRTAPLRLSALLLLPLLLAPVLLKAQAPTYRNYLPGRAVDVKTIKGFGAQSGVLYTYQVGTVELYINRTGLDGTQVGGVPPAGYPKEINDGSNNGGGKLSSIGGLAFTVAGSTNPGGFPTADTSYDAAVSAIDPIFNLAASPPSQRMAVVSNTAMGTDPVNVFEEINAISSSSFASGGFPALILGGTLNDEVGTEPSRPFITGVAANGVPTFVGYALDFSGAARTHNVFEASNDEKILVGTEGNNVFVASFSNFPLLTPNWQISIAPGLLNTDRFEQPSIAEAADGDLLVVVNAVDGGAQNAWVFKLDPATGTVNTVQKLGTNSSGDGDTRVNDIHVNADGTVALAGSFNGESAMMVLSADLTTHVFTVRYPDPTYINSEIVAIDDVLASNGGGFVAVGNTNNGIGDMFQMRVDRNYHLDCSVDQPDTTFLSNPVVVVDYAAAAASVTPILLVVGLDIAPFIPYNPTLTVDPAFSYASRNDGDALGAITIDADPANAVICPERSVELSVPSVAGATYQWQRNGGDIPGATGTTYTAFEGGDYSVNIVYGFCDVIVGPETVSESSLNVEVEVVEGDPDLPNGSTARLIAYPSGGATSVTWLLDGEVIPGSSALDTVVSDNGTYIAVASDGTCTAPSNPVNVVIVGGGSAAPGTAFNKLFTNLSEKTGFQGFEVTQGGDFIGGLGEVVARFDAAGNPIWSVRLDSIRNVTAVAELRDGFVAVGPTRPGVEGVEVGMARIAANGTVQWTRTWGGTGDDTPVDVIAVRDTNFAILAQSNSFGADGQDMVLLRVGSRGNVTLQQRFATSDAGATTYNETPTSLLRAPTGDYYLAGYRAPAAGTNTGLVIKADRDGNLLWTRVLSGGSQIEGLALLQDELYYTGSAANSLLFGSLAADGTPTGPFTGAAGTTRGQDIQEGYNGNLYITGYSNLAGTDSRLLVLEASTAGTTVSAQTIDAPSLQAGLHIRPLPDGGFVHAGVSQEVASAGGSPTRGDAWLLRSDAAGNLGGGSCLAATAATLPLAAAALTLDPLAEATATNLNSNSTNFSRPRPALALTIDERCPVQQDPCNATADWTFTQEDIATGTPDACVGGRIQVTSNTTGTPYITWVIGGDVFSREPNPTFNLTVGGIYEIVLFAGDSACNAVDTQYVVVSDTALNISSVRTNFPCDGDDLVLEAELKPNAQYEWRDPLGNFLSNERIVTIPNASSANDGIYTVFAYADNSNGRCQGPDATVDVTVKPKPNAPANFTSSSPVCTGDQIIFGWDRPSNIDPLATVDYEIFFGVNNDPIVSTPNNTHTIVPAELFDNGQFKLVATVDGCLSDTAFTDVIVYQRPPRPVLTATGANVTRCEDFPLLLGVDSLPNVTYVWTDPNGNEYIQDSISIPTVALTDAGDWDVVAVQNACTSAVATVNLTVNPEPDPMVVDSIFVNGDTVTVAEPFCTGEDFNFSLNPMITHVPGTEYLWQGPNGFSVVGNTPSILSVTTLETGQYDVYAISLGCTSTVASFTLNVTAIPPRPELEAKNDPICLEETAELSVVDQGAQYTYFWTGPTGNDLGTGTSITIPDVSIADSGRYTIRAEENGCPGPNLVVNFVINTPPPAPVISTPDPIIVCTSRQFRLGVEPDLNRDVRFEWFGPNGFSSTLLNPIITDVALADSGIYQVVRSINDCVSDTSQVRVVVRETPDAPVLAANNGPICAGETLNLESQAEPGVDYLWEGPFNFISTEQNPSIPDAQPWQSGRYDVFAISLGCTSLVSSTDAVIHARPKASFGVSNEFFLVGRTLQFEDRSEGAVEYEWLVDGIPFSTIPEPSFLFDGPGTFEFQLRVTNVEGCDDLSPVRTVQAFADPTSLPASAAQDLSAVLYPNPNDGRFTLELSGLPASAQTVSLRLFSLQGKALRSWEAAPVNGLLTHQIALEGVAAGAYLLQARAGDAGLSIPVVIQK